MTIAEATTGHDPISEKRFARTLFIALVLAVLIVAFFSLAVGQKDTLNPLKPSTHTEIPADSTAPGR